MYLLLEEGFNELLILTLTMKWGRGLVYKQARVGRVVHNIQTSRIYGCRCQYSSSLPLSGDLRAVLLGLYLMSK